MKKIIICNGLSDFENLSLPDLREADLALIWDKEIQIVKDRSEKPKFVSENELLKKICELHKHG
jgi:hypothetical protein